MHNLIDTLLGWIEDHISERALFIIALVSIPLGIFAPWIAGLFR